VLTVIAGSSSVLRLLAVGLAAAAGIVLALAFAKPGHDASPVEAPAAPTARALPSQPGVAPRPAVTASPTRATRPTVEDVMHPSASTDVLVAGLEGDAVVIAEACNALVARGDVAALPALLAYDVLNRPSAAPSVIDALGRLGAMTDEEQRGDVVARLLALLETEKQRRAVESAGNILQIYEALGRTGDARAIAPLERELVDADVATAPKVVVVEALVALGARRSVAVLERLSQDLAASEASGFEAELRRDLFAAIQAALVKLS
jgi:hypothetical protein